MGDAFPEERDSLQRLAAASDDDAAAASHAETPLSPEEVRHRDRLKRNVHELAHRHDDSTFSSVEKEGLLVLTRGLENFQSLKGSASGKVLRVLSATEQHTLLEFLQYMKGNLPFNARLEKILEADSIPYGISESALKYSKTFSFKSRHLDALIPLTEKLATAWYQNAEGKTVPKEEKITLQELGILRTMERWGRDLGQVFRLLSECSKEHSMYMTIEHSVAAHARLRKTYEQIQATINRDQTYQSGDLLLTIWTRKVKTMQGNRPPQAFSFLMSFTRYEHTAIIYRNQNEESGPVGEPRLSHMIREYHDSELTLEDLASSDIFRIRVAALVTDKRIRQKLQDTLGEDWPQIVQERYCGIESTLHSSKQATLGGITNPLSRVMNIGTAAIMPWTRIRRTNMDFEGIRTSLFDGAQNEDMQMTCSEFAAKSAIAALLELDTQLKEELDLSEKISSKYCTCVFVLPFHTKEKFKTMQPDRLRHLLSDHKALEKVDYPSFIGNVVKL